MQCLVQQLGTPVVTMATAHITLAKTGPQDNPEAFLELFEQVAEAWCWPDSQCSASYCLYCPEKTSLQPNHLQ